MSQTAERHLGAMCMAIKRDLVSAGPFARRPALGPEARECLAEGNWEGVAVAYLADIVAGRRVSMGPDALQHFNAWIQMDDVIRPRFMQELIADFNRLADQLVAQVEAESRPLNRAERRAQKIKRKS